MTSISCDCSKWRGRTYIHRFSSINVAETIEIFCVVSFLTQSSIFSPIASNGEMYNVYRPRGLSVVPGNDKSISWLLCNITACFIKLYVMVIYI